MRASLETTDGKSIKSVVRAGLMDSTSPKEHGIVRKFGKQCTRCNGYYVTDRFDERVCLWCQKVELGLEEPVLSLLPPDMFQDEIRNIRLVSQLRRE